MRFHAMLPVRDEADILAQSLQRLLTWADAIYVFDTGSVDETWDIVQDFAAREPRIKPLRKDEVYFTDSTVRGWLFHQARKEMRDGDWFLRVDADEFHHVPPPEFVRSRLRRHETIVWHQYYDFRLTGAEVAAWERGEETLADRGRRIEDRRRWFTPSSYSEPRLCRYRSTMKWPIINSFPFNAGYAARERLPIRHYPHRDPAQLDRRCRIRAFMIAHRGAQLFTGYNLSDIDRARLLLTEAKSSVGATADEKIATEWRRFVVPNNLPELQKWELGSPLPEFGFTNHLSRPHVRVAQRLIHPFLLPLLDMRRPGWTDADYPERIPAALTGQLGALFARSGRH